MKLHFLLAERDIRNRTDFKSLSEVSQKQLRIALSKWQGKKMPLGKAIKLNFSANCWNIIEGNIYNKILYNYWEINDAYGILFQPQSLNDLAIYIGGKLEQEGNGGGELFELLKHLQTAERLYFENLQFYFNSKDQVLDFVSAQFIPDSLSNWRRLLKRLKLSSEFIYKYSKYFDKKCWIAIGQYSELEIDIIRIYGRKIGWGNISLYQSLSIDLLSEFQDDLDWEIISRYRNLSESFIREFNESLAWDCIIPRIVN